MASQQGESEFMVRGLEDKDRDRVIEHWQVVVAQDLSWSSPWGRHSELAAMGCPKRNL